MVNQLALDKVELNPMDNFRMSGNYADDSQVTEIRW
jgi:hypothetical protein